jgi:hypothetical protein
VRPLNDAVLRRRLAARAASNETGSLAEFATFVTARPQRRMVGPFRRWSVLGSVAATVVAGVVIGAALLARDAQPPASLGLASGSPGPATVAPTTRSLPPTSSPTSSISGCDALRFDARRCAAVIARARERAGNPANVVSVLVGAPDRSGGVLLGGGAAIATVDFTLADGSHERADVICGGLASVVSSDRACSIDPQIGIYGGVSRDVPCGPTPCDEQNPGATLPPSPRPAVVAASTPLVLRTFDVRLDHVGHYDAFVGNAWLPDGLLTERSGSIGDPRPTGYWIDNGITIEVRPVPPCPGGCPVSIESIYHQPFHGPQPVRVYLVFDVVELNVPGTVLEIRNLVVR